MDVQSIVAKMGSNAQAIRSLVRECSEQEARWKPSATSWSILEVINHLLDEEREDFRKRIDVVLHRNEEAWFRIDPEGWATERGYNQRELEPSLRGFLAAREESLDWLRGLGEAAWTKEYEAPFGKIRAGDFLAAWLAHDVLHMRQLIRLKWNYLVQEVAPYRVRYAGDW